MHASRGGDVNSDQESPIYEYYLAHGGAAGMLGTPTSDEEPSPGADLGRHRHFCGTVYGRVHGVSIHASRDKVPASCHRPDVSGTPVEATVAWSEETGAHAVLGEIRALWLELGPREDVWATPCPTSCRPRTAGGAVPGSSSAKSGGT